MGLLDSKTTFGNKTIQVDGVEYRVTIVARFHGMFRHYLPKRDYDVLYIWPKPEHHDRVLAAIHESLGYLSEWVWSGGESASCSLSPSITASCSSSISPSPSGFDEEDGEVDVVQEDCL